MESIAKVSTVEPRITSAQVQNNSSYITTGLLRKGTNQDKISFSNAKQTNPIETAFDDLLAEKAPRLFLKKYMNRKVIENAAIINPKIREILESEGLPCVCYMENITGKNQEHFITTYEKAKKLGKNLSSDDKKTLSKAALLHDIGKAYIPAEVLGKRGSLSKKERDIVNLHARLGEEILKTTGLPPKVAVIAGLHHMPCSVPFKGVSANILSVADNYSALKEERPYKPKFSNKQVAQIMQSNSNLDSSIVAKCF